MAIVSHYAKSLIFVQKVEFDKTYFEFISVKSKPP